MNVRGRPPLLAVYGIVLLRLSTSDRLLSYVRPGSRPYILAAGIALTVVGGVHWMRAETHRSHARASWVGWLLFAPVLTLTMVSPPPEGALVSRESPGPPSRPAQVLDPLRGNDPITLQLSDLVVRAAWDSDSLSGHRLRVIGFVHGGRGRSFTLARLTITCCAADAQEDEIDVRVTDAQQLRPRQWVAVTGRFAGMSARERFVPTLLATSVAGVEAPANPYD